MRARPSVPGAVGTLAALGLHHSLSLVPCKLYHRVHLYSVPALGLSSTTPCPDLAADVTCVTSRNLSRLLYVTHHHDIVNPLPPRRVFMDGP